MGSKTSLQPEKRNTLDFISSAFSEKRIAWAEEQGIALNHIQPGKPQQNAYIERFNRTIRHAWLNQHIIEIIEEAQAFATNWLWQYNNERPNMGIGGITPARRLKMAG